MGINDKKGQDMKFNDLVAGKSLSIANLLSLSDKNLAKKIKDDGKKIYYYKNIIVDHKEDGSMDLANIEEYSHLKDSYILYYERYKK